MNDLLGEMNNQRSLSLPLTTGNALNSDIWMVAGVPLGNDKFWIYRDTNAVTDHFNDMIGITINEFSLSHDRVQMFDNPKYLYLTSQSHEVGKSGKITFTCHMKSSMINCNFDDYRDGFGSFNVQDFNTGMVFDIISNGRRLWVIYERLLMPGKTTEQEAFTEVIPVERPTHPDELLHCAVVYDKSHDTARYYIDYDLIYEVKDIPVEISSLQTGFGFITLHPIENGQSASCRGQGGRGLWGCFKVISI